MLYLKLRNQFTCVKKNVFPYRMLQIQKQQNNKSIRQAVAKLSLIGGQGFLKYGCQKKIKRPKQISVINQIYHVGVGTKIVFYFGI